MNQFNKRPRADSPQNIPIPSNSYQNPEPALTSAPSITSHAHGSAASSFRNVSACNRCRLRKNRCDQNLPSCASCEKAKVRCVGYDHITKREIPRAYVYYLESRVSYLEELLNSRGIAFAPAEDFGVGTTKQNHNEDHKTSPPQADRQPANTTKLSASEEKRKRSEAEKLNKLVSNIGMVSVQGASDPRYLGSTSGISFARVVFAAVRSSISGSTSDRAGIRPGRLSGAAAVNGTNMRDSFFGLQSKPAFKKAAFPDKELGEKLVNLYFENANPQIPTLHRGEFMALFNRAYASEDRRRSPRELYMLNIVFAIGAGIIFGGPTPNGSNASAQNDVSNEDQKQRYSRIQHQPEEYHASAMVHLEYFLSSTPAAERPEGFGGSLEELQAVLLLASFALLRPVAPGLWYIVGVAMRLAVDLGLHYEDGTGIEDSMGGTVIPRSQEITMEAAGTRPSPIDPREKGRREWVRDLRRRLWWCVYSFDRLVSTCVGRPFGITDQVITTEFPANLDDNYITTSGFAGPPGAELEPSYKRVSLHYFRLRLLQSEILQVLQHRQARQARARGRNANNRWMHKKMPSPFLQGFESFYAWRADIDRRLWEWKQSSPTQKEIGVSFNVLLIELNYWQAIIMLYRQSLSVPHELGGEPSPREGVMSPQETQLEEENEDEVFLKVATAGQKVLKLYYQLHRAHIVNYTFLATHHLFMAGIAFLYAIWHSTTVRNLLSIDDVDYTVLAATTVLQSLAEKCPPAETCRDAFERMAKATVAMVLKTSGFGNKAPLLGVPKPKRPRSTSPHGHSRNISTNSNPGLMQPQSPPHPTMQHQPPPFYQNEYSQIQPPRSHFQFDMNLRELFPDDTPESQRFRTVRWGLAQQQPRSQMDIANNQQNMDYATPTHSPASPSGSFHSPASTPVPVQHSTPQPPPTLQHQVSSHSQQAPGTPNSGYNTYPMEQHTPQPMPPQNANLPYTGTPVAAPIDAVSVASMAGTPPPQGYENVGVGFQDDLNFLLGSDGNGNGAYMGNSGMSLGFDTDHDWNDGTGPDLFDGYWFRPGWGSMQVDGGIAALVNGAQGGGVPMDGSMGLGTGTPGVGVQGQGQDWGPGVKMEQ